jgi:hypothetical protein
LHELLGLPGDDSNNKITFVKGNRQFYIVSFDSIIYQVDLYSPLSNAHQLTILEFPTPTKHKGL